MVQRKVPSDVVRYSHLGLQFAVILFLAVFGGVQLDKRLGTGGLFTILGTFAGASLGFYVLYRETQRISRPDPADPDPPDGGTRRDRSDPDEPHRRD